MDCYSCKICSQPQAILNYRCDCNGLTSNVQPLRRIYASACSPGFSRPTTTTSTCVDAGKVSPHSLSKTSAYNSRSRLPCHTSHSAHNVPEVPHPNSTTTSISTFATLPLHNTKLRMSCSRTDSFASKTSSRAIQDSKWGHCQGDANCRATLLIITRCASRGLINDDGRCRCSGCPSTCGESCARFCHKTND